MPGQLLTARAMLHFGEEPPLCGENGTGAVFFSGCTLGCSFCQNREISLAGKGLSLSSQRLREIFLMLIEQGAGSIDLVTPTQFLPSILPALYPKLPVPVIYNCGGYERVETLKELDGLVDIYLPDFKYSDSALAEKLSLAKDYPAVCREALTEMYRQVGAPQYDQTGKMTRGLMVRHLVLPGHVDNSLGVTEEMASLFPKREIPISLMSQYVPAPHMEAPLNRPVSEEEYAAVLSWMELYGLKGYMQDRCSATEELLPVFNFEGIL